MIFEEGYAAGKRTVFLSEKSFQTAHEVNKFEFGPHLYCVQKFYKFLNAAAEGLHCDLRKMES